MDTRSTLRPEGTGPANPDRKTILVVDDQAVLRTILSHALGQLGYRVITAVDGLDAIRKIVAFPGTIDVLITDLMMPGMGGDELLDYVAVLRPRMKAMCLSATLTDVALHRGVLSLPKPFSLHTVVRTVTEVLAAAVPEPSRPAGDPAPRRAVGS